MVKWDDEKGNKIMYLFKLYFFLISEIFSQLQEKSGFVTLSVLIPETFNWCSKRFRTVSLSKSVLLVPSGRVVSVEDQISDEA